MITLTFSKAGADDIVLSEDDLFDFDYEHSCFSGETFELGGVNARRLSLIIDNNGNRYSRGAFANTRARLEVDGEHIAEFNCELPKRRDGIIELVAYDDITKLDTEYPTDYEFPQTFRVVYAQCLYEGGLVSSPTSLDKEYVNNGISKTGVISHEYTDYIYANSCRQLVSGMAEWNGGFCFINSDGRFQIQPFAKEISKEFTSSKLMDLDYSDEAVAFTKIKTSQKNKTYELGTDDGYTLVIRNQYIQYGLGDIAFENYLAAMHDYYNGFTLTPMSFTLAEPDFSLKLGDRISVYDVEEDITVVGNISKIQMSGNLTMTITCGGFGNVGSVSGYNPTSASQISQTKSIASSSQQFSATFASYEYLSDASIKFNDTTYDIAFDADGLIEAISNGQSEFRPTKTGEITDIAFHNAVFTAIAMLCGLPKPAPDDTLTEMVQYRYNNDVSVVDGSDISWSNQAFGADNSLVWTGSSKQDGGIYITGAKGSVGALTYAPDVQAVDEYTIYLVARGVTASSVRFFNSSGSGSLGTAASIYSDSGLWRVTNYVNSNTPLASSGVPSTSKSVVVMRRKTDGTLEYWVNGNLVDSAVAGVQLAAGSFSFGWTFVLSGLYDGNGFYFYDFALAESAHSEADILTNSKYLMTKYGIE